jgi:hypothetical protein
MTPTLQTLPPHTPLPYRTVLSIARAALCMVAATCVSGCCSESDKRALQEMVDRAIERNFKACRGLSDQHLQHSCITNAQNQQTALVTAYSAYWTACATGDTELIKRALEGLKELLKSSNRTALSAAGVVANTEMVLGREESVSFSIQMTSDGTRLPQDFIVIDSTKYLPEAAGSAALAVNEADGPLTISTVSGDLAANSYTTFAIDPTSTISFNASGLSLTGQISGSMSFSMGGTTSSPTWVPTAGSLTVTVAGSSFTLTLDKTCKFNSLVVDQTGKGTLGVRFNFAPGNGSTLPARLPEGAWMAIPVQMTTSGTQLLATSGSSALSGWTLFPALPNPIADFDGNGMVNDADMSAFLASWTTGDLSADVNHDGTLSSADYDTLMARWNYWRQP